VDPLASGSNLMDRHFLGDRHYQVAHDVREHLARYRELEDIITMLGLEELSETDRLVVQRARRLQRYLTQPFHAMTAQNAAAGVSVPLPHPGRAGLPRRGQDGRGREREDPRA
jgi:F-type H+-transporting ATPase subunit beta